MRERPGEKVLDTVRRFCFFFFGHKACGILVPLLEFPRPPGNSPQSGFLFSCEPP